MGPSDLTGDNCEGPIALAGPFEPVGMDKHGMGDAAPFTHKPGASLQRNRQCDRARRRRTSACPGITPPAAPYDLASALSVP